MRLPVWGPVGGRCVRLLHDVGQLMDDQLFPSLAVWHVLGRIEYYVVADRVGAGAHFTGRLGRFRTDMDTHPRKVMA